jgi:hypothetical protein
LLLLLASLLTQSDSARADLRRPAPEVTIPRIEAAVTVDGVLDEPPWSRAARLGGFSQYEPVDGRPAQERTEVLVWYAPDAIHFGILAYDSQPGTIRATRADRDNIDGEDHVVLYLDTFNDRRRAFFFAVNALGVQQDGVRSEGAVSAGRMFGGNIDTNPDYLFDSSGRVTPEGYVVEVRIPFKSLRYPGSTEQSWGVNVLRKIQRTGYTDTWTDVRRASASFLVQSGTIAGLHDLRGGVVLEAQPFMTATASGARDAASDVFERSGVDADAGINLRAGLTSFALDATINPDFSQVESDASQVTVNERFALFFSEKRPFFLDGIELFNTPNQLVYTRRIVDPIAGGKIAGKIGSVGVAHITAVDDESGAEGEALFNVTRLRRDFGSNSLAGLTFTDRSVLEGGDYNRVLAGDIRYVFGRLYYFEAQLGSSWSRASTPGAGVSESFSAPLWNLELDRTGRSWGFNYQLNGIGTDFVSRAGFVPRSDIVQAHAFNRFSLYGQPGALLETVTVFVGPTRIWRYADLLDAGPIEGGENVNLMMRLRGGWQANARVARDFVALDPAAYVSFATGAPGATTPYLPLERVSGPSLQLGATTPTWRALDATATLSRGRVPIFAEGSEGTRTSLSGGLSARPGESLRMAATVTVQRLTRRRDGGEFARTVIPRLKLEYQPSRALFFRAVGEYRAERRAALEDARTGVPLIGPAALVDGFEINDLRVDLLASFEPSPGTVAFLGYGSSLVSARTFGFADLERVDDGIFLKLAYQFRR